MLTPHRLVRTRLRHRQCLVDVAGTRCALLRTGRAMALAGAASAGLVSAGTVSWIWTSMVALPVTRSVRALPRACSMVEQVPAATWSWARRSMAAQAVAASSLGKVPCHSSTPGSATQRRSPVALRARLARSRTRSGEIRSSRTRVRRRSVAASSPKCAAEGGDDGVGDVGGGDLELEGDDGGPVPVELPGRHRLVQTVQAAGLRGVAVLGRDRDPPCGQAHRGLDAPLRLGVRGAENGGDEVGGVQGHPPGAVHGLAQGAVLTPGALASGGFGDRGVLHRGEGVDQRLAGTGELEPVLAVTSELVRPARR